MHAWLYTCACTHMYVRMYSDVYKCRHTHAHIHTCEHTVFDVCSLDKSNQYKDSKINSAYQNFYLTEFVHISFN
jgi:hypothetical protein